MSEILNGIIVGGGLVAIIRAVENGLKHRASAKGRRFTALDAAITSRHNLVVHCHAVRELASRAGVDVPPLPPDPYADLMSKEPIP